MKVYALVGKSGTGKSFQATYLCGQMNIEYIVDDGLLIGRGAVLAGVSAKRQQTKIGAVKTALFQREEHREAVRSKIQELNPERILVIATSEAMAEKIRERLALPEFERLIRIEEITTEEERKIAAKQRKEQGKHVIPVPALQLKQQFSGYFMDPIRRFIGFGGKSGAAASERTVVRPTYSYLGKYEISDRVILDIAGHICMSSEAVRKVSRLHLSKTERGIRIEMSLLMKGRGTLEKAEEIQRRTALAVGEMTAFNVEDVRIEIREIRG